MSLPKYPLEQLAIIKQKKLDEAEKILNEKKEALAKEQAKLEKVKKIRDEALVHKQDKLQQLRDELDHGTTTDVIQRMKRYLTIVDEDLAAKENTVNEQKKHVAAAKIALEEARAVFFQRQKDVEKLKLHREDWEKEMRKILVRKEEAVSDELGSAMHIIKKTGHLPRHSPSQEKKKRKGS